MQRLKKENLLITGLPGVGKTTLIKKISDSLMDLNPVGFYTEEIREEGIRKGFELVSFDGRKVILFHTDIKSPYRVGKYRVDVKGFEEFLGSIPFFNPNAHLMMIDEIGKMECLSDSFKKLMKELLDSEKSVIATIALKGGGFMGKTKKRNDMKLFEITQRNRNSLLADILSEVIEDV